MKPSMLSGVVIINTMAVAVLWCNIAVQADETSLRLNCSDRYWYPFLYVQDDQVKGIFYDMIEQASENLGISVSVIPVHFRRAMVNVGKGRSDGVIALGYQEPFARVLEYPPDAERDGESPWRLLQVDHVVVSMAGDVYEFDGKLRTLPQPVRLLQGSPINEDLKAVGITAQEVREDVQNFLKLVRDEKGVIITTSVAAEMMIRDPRFQRRIKIHPMPVASHSYYLVFSKKSVFSGAAREKMWREIRDLRDDYIFMLQVFSRY